MYWKILKDRGICLPSFLWNYRIYITECNVGICTFQFNRWHLYTRLRANAVTQLLFHDIKSWWVRNWKSESNFFSHLLATIKLSHSLKNAFIYIGCGPLMTIEYHRLYAFKTLDRHSNAPWSVKQILYHRRNGVKSRSR